MSLQDFSVDHELRSATVRHPAKVAVGIYQASSYGPIRQLCCEYEGGVLTISGRLPSYYLKQLAQTLVLNIEGVQRIMNQVEVEG